jgi:hypothetical protein
MPPKEAPEEIIAEAPSMLARMRRSDLSGIRFKRSPVAVLAVHRHRLAGARSGIDVRPAGSAPQNPFDPGELNLMNGFSKRR